MHFTTVENMLEASDTVVVGVQYDGTLSPYVRLQSAGNTEWYSAVGSLDAVRASAGATYWQDTANNRIWAKLRGGVWVPSAEDPVYQDDLLYEPCLLIIRP